MIKRLLLLAGSLLLIVAAAATLVLSDPNRFKGELQALLAEQTGIPLEIRGDLDWRLLPPLVLTANDVHAQSDMSVLSKAGMPALHLLQNPNGYFMYHHTPNDTFDKVNKRELELGAASMAASFAKLF